MTSPGRPTPGAEPRPGAADEADLRVELARYQALVEYAPDAIVILDLAAGRFVSVNAAAEQLFGLTRAELLRVGPVQVSPPVQPDGRSSGSAAAAYLARAMAGERPRFPWTHRRADGTDVLCEITLLRLPDPDPGRSLVRGSILDATARHEAEAARAVAITEQAARRAAEAGVARLQATVAGLNAIVWERDPATLRLTFVNERAEQVLGYAAEQWMADEDLWARILHPADRDAALARVRDEVAGGGVDFTLTYRVRTADDRWVWLQHLGHITRDESGAPLTLHAVLVDVTAARRRERAAVLLAAAGRALTGSGGVEPRLTEIAELLAGELGEWAAVWLRGDDERFRPVAAAPAAVADGVLGVGPLRVPPELAEAVDAGRAFVVPEVTEPTLRVAAADDARLAALRALGGRTWLVASLRAAGDVIGLLTVATDSRSGYDESDVAFAADLAQRIATMVAAERLAMQRGQLLEVTADLAAAGTVPEAGAAVTSGLQAVLGASVVAVCTLGSDGLLHTVGVRGYAHPRPAWFDTLRLSDPFPLADAARSRHPVWLRDRAAVQERYPAVVPRLQEHTEALAVLPLLVGERLVGVLGVSFRTPRRFDAGERGFLLTVAGQVAAALERATLADVRRDMAETLQRSLLPAQLPRPDRLSVAARYLPAVAGTSAGGDWFDVLVLAEGRVAVAVGDVVGHGSAAAAVMGQLRSSLATLLLAGFRPGRALELLDRFAGQVTGARVSTAACLLLDSGTGEVAYSRAGHPPPLLAGRTGATFLDDGLGPALGLPGRGARPDAVAALPLGAAVLLYTDGLIEARSADLDEGLRLLATAVTRRSPAPLDALVDGVLADLVGDEGTADDIAVVAIRPLPAPLRLLVAADPSRLTGVRRAVAGWAAEAALGSDAVDDLQLAVGEAVANGVEHAYRDATAPGTVLLELHADGDGGVRASVVDHGVWRPAPADPGSRGRGLQIITALAADLAVEHSPDGTTLRFRLPPAAVRPASARDAGSEDSTGRHGPARLEIREAHGRRCVELVGDLDLVGVEAVQGALFDELAGGRPVVLDLTRLGVLTSVGAGMLLEVAEAAGEAGVDVEVLLPRDGPVRRLLDLTGLTGTLVGGSPPAR